MACSTCSQLLRSDFHGKEFARSRYRRYGILTHDRLSAMRSESAVAYSWAHTELDRRWAAVAYRA